MPPKKTKAAPAKNLSGQTVSFTGTLSQITRAEATERAIAAGAKITTTVTKATTVLVAGAGAGKKIEDAEKKGVEVWTEDEFIAAAGSVVAESKDMDVEEDKPAKKGAKKGSKAVETEASVPAPKKGSKKRKQEEEEEEEVAETKSVPAPKAKGKKGKAAEEKIEEEIDEPPAPKKKAPAKKGKAAKKDDEDEEVVDEQPKKVAKAEVSETKAEPVKSEGRSGERKVDRELPSASNYTVHEDFDCYLAQTNLSDTTAGNNKFYVIQVVKDGSGYCVWTRWGRIGGHFQSNLDRCGGLDAAIKGFEKKFLDKTKNHWRNKSSFVKYDGKYELVEIEEKGDDGEDRLSKEQIGRGQAVLAQLKLNLGNTPVIKQLSGKFYSLIPTKTGYKSPPPLNTLAMIEEKEALLEFWLRMGFEDMKETKAGVIEGVMDLPVPPTLQAAASKVSDSHSISSSRQRGEQLSIAKAGNPVKNMGPELYAAILLYTGNSIYAELNRVLRSENRHQAQKFFDYLRLFFEAMSCMPTTERTLWRGISVDLFDQYQEGKIITWWSVSSTTADENVARNFMQGCGGNCTLLTLECKTAMDISALSFYANEKESLLAPGTQLQVLSRKRNGKIAEIRVREVGRAI